MENAKQTTKLEDISITAVSLAFSPDAGKLAGGDNEGRVYLWDTSTGKRLWRSDVGGIH